MPLLYVPNTSKLVFEVTTATLTLIAPLLNIGNAEKWALNNVSLHRLTVVQTVVAYTSLSFSHQAIGLKTK